MKGAEIPWELRIYTGISKTYIKLLHPSQKVAHLVFE
jgi:hypothetical protein